TNRSLLFSEDPQESKDTDGDGIGNNADPDDDNDGIPDKDDRHPKDPDAGWIRLFSYKLPTKYIINFLEIIGMSSPLLVCLLVLGQAWKWRRYHFIKNGIEGAETRKEIDRFWDSRADLMINGGVVDVREAIKLKDLFDKRRKKMKKKHKKNKYKYWEGPQPPMMPMAEYPMEGMEGAPETGDALAAPAIDDSSEQSEEMIVEEPVEIPMKEDTQRPDIIEEIPEDAFEEPEVKEEITVVEDMVSAPEEEPEDQAEPDSPEESSGIVFEEALDKPEPDVGSDWDEVEENPADALEEELEEEMFDMSEDSIEADEIGKGTPVGVPNFQSEPDGLGFSSEDEWGEQTAPPTSIDIEPAKEPSDTPPPPEALPPSDEIDFDDLMDELG
ncbi:MAG: hypothetical protein QGH39_05750, partial [Candidatus Thermoplasmatota archaeon]|nr:hypothetical protein [Candidatus Thermoplasmatota archaeon]